MNKDADRAYALNPVRFDIDQSRFLSVVNSLSRYFLSCTQRYLIRKTIGHHRVGDQSGGTEMICRDTRWRRWTSPVDENDRAELPMENLENCPTGGNSAERTWILEGGVSHFHLPRR